MPRAKCKNTEHKDRAIRGSKSVVCEVCNDRFPCLGTCGHWDCRLERGEQLPDGVTLVE